MAKRSADGGERRGGAASRLMRVMTIEPAAERCLVAETYVARLRGLLGRRLKAGEGLLLVPCSAVHTFFMRYPIDVVFLDRELRAVRVRSTRSPRPRKPTASESRAQNGGTQRP